MIVSTAELARHLDDPDWIIFDCRHDLMKPDRGAEIFGEGHISSAHFAGVDRDLSGKKTGSNGRHPLPDPQAFADFLARHGVTADSRIVGYDDVGGQYAARLWWMTRWIGLKGGAVLDGGWPKWVSENLPISTEIPVVSPGEVVAQVDDTLLVGVSELAPKVATSDVCIVDARAPERYRGDVEPLDPVAGHIPGAQNVFFKSNLNSDLTLKSPAELKANFASAGLSESPTEVVHQCGSGITACVNLLAMERAGLMGSRLYAGSWSEWVADPHRPVSRGE
ncbi:MAG: sulfurtransferase [Synoicihabitans sp.]